MTPTHEHTHDHPRPARRKISGPKAALFIAMALTPFLLLIALGLTAYNLRMLRERKRLSEIAIWHMKPMTMASYPGVVTPEREPHLRACFKRPEAVDFNKVSWGLNCRPSPFVNYAPEPGEQGEGHFNAQQLRNRQDVALPKPAGVYRIFLTGGSQAYGIGAPSQDETISAYLEQILNERGFAPGKKVEVFNAAVCGWASTHERIMIENRISEWQPDLVIALTGANDVHWGFLGADVQFLRTYEDEFYLAAINAAMRWVHAPDYPLTPPSVTGKPIAPEEVGRRFARNMRLAALALEPTGARLVVALQPTLSTAAKTLSDGERRWLEGREAPGKVDYLERCFAAMRSALASESTTSTAALARNPANLSPVQIRDVFKGRSDAIFYDLFHMADKGNELVARRIAGELARLKP